MSLVKYALLYSGGKGPVAEEPSPGSGYSRSYDCMSLTVGIVGYLIADQDSMVYLFRWYHCRCWISQRW
jgi:hypothetical protein